MSTERVYQRHFEPAEANAMLPRLRDVLAQLREARDRLTDEEVRAALAEASAGNGGGQPGRHVGEAFLEVRGMLVGLAETGLVLRDIDRGLIDFPSIRDGREVFLCWELGEDEVGFWHELEAGYGGREPLG